MFTHYYINQCDEKTIQKFEQTYQKSPAELEEIIRKNLKIYCGSRAITGGAKWTNLPYVYTLLLFGNVAIDSAAEAIFSKPLNLGIYNYFITAPLALCDLVLYTFIISSTEIAVSDTLAYAFSKPAKEIVKDRFLKLKNQPLESLKDFAHFCAFMIPSATMGGFPRIYAFQEIFHVKNKLAQLSFQIPLIAIGIYFNTKLQGEDYYRNFAELSKQFKEGTFLKGTDSYTKAHIFIQFICNIGTSAYPIYFAQAVLGEAFLGWWFPPILVSILAAWQQTMSTFLNISREYTEDYDFVTEALIKEISPVLENKATPFETVQNQFGQTASRYFRETHHEDFVIEKFVTLYRATKHDPEIYAEQPCFYTLRKHPSTITSLILLRVMVAIYFGYQMSKDISLSKIESVFALGAPTAILLTYGLYQTKKRVQLNRDLRIKYSPPTENKILPKNTFIKNGILIASFGSTVIGAMFLISSLYLLIKDTEPVTRNQMMTAMLFMAFESAIYNLEYNFSKIESIAETMQQRFFKSKEILPTISEEKEVRIHIGSPVRGKQSRDH